MYRDPCAMLMMREAPKISDRPTATRHRPEAVESPLSACKRHPLKVMSAHLSPQGGERLTKDVTNENLVRFDRPELLHLGVARQHGCAVDIFEVGHGALAAFEDDLADIGPHRRLMIAGSIDKRPERTINLEAFERLDQFLGIGRLCLGNACSK